MHVGIVGSEAAKFTSAMEQLACGVIYELINASPPNSVIVSGGCHLGGIDIWAEQIAKEIGAPTLIHKPKKLQWNGGFRERNLLIARDCEIVHCIVVAGYHSAYRGPRFNGCPHCKTNQHVKSGGCWTAIRAKKAEWHIIDVIE